MVARAAAVVLLDLDDFKLVNDTDGHDAGDRVLVEVSRRLMGVTRNGEETVFRLGGDEIPGVPGSAGDPFRMPCAWQTRIAVALSEPLQLGDRQVRPLACIGISIALDGQNRGVLLAEADLAMYAGKARGTSPFRVRPGPASRDARPKSS